MEFAPYRVLILAKSVNGDRNLSFFSTGAANQTEMANNAKLIAPLERFTVAVKTEAAARQNQIAQLVH